MVALFAPGCEWRPCTSARWLPCWQGAAIPSLHAVSFISVQSVRAKLQADCMAVLCN